jgi:hypothetical protein
LTRGPDNGRTIFKFATLDTSLQAGGEASVLRKGTAEAQEQADDPLLGESYR